MITATTAAELFDINCNMTCQRPRGFFIKLARAAAIPQLIHCTCAVCFDEINFAMMQVVQIPVQLQGLLCSGVESWTFGDCPAQICLGLAYVGQENEYNCILAIQLYLLFCMKVV